MEPRGEDVAYLPTSVTTVVGADNLTASAESVNPLVDTTTQIKPKWKGCPKDQFTYTFTVLIIACIIAVSLYNLSTKTEKSEVWTGTLSFSLAALLPNPKIKTVK
jgi:hypothetical protein